MKNKISIAQMMQKAKRLKDNGDRFTMMGIGPMSRTLVRATLELGMERDFPIMLIASRNQVDSDEFGGGYVCSWDQDRFVNEVNQISAEIGFNGLVYLCRDHGGPWQRDEERTKKLPTEVAMEISKRSYLHDIESGFDLLHIDPTKDPHIDGTVALELVLERTIELIEYLENQRKIKKLPEVSYEVGTEETNGGLTSEIAFQDFINKLTNELKQKNLPLPAFVVGQTGTLTRLVENVGHFNPKYAAKLADIAAKCGVGLKEHNADYLRDCIILEHPVLNITASNVAPEFGVIETKAYLELAFLEQQMIAKDNCSNLLETIKVESIRSERWRKWMVGADVNASIYEVMQNDELSSLITNICGHYTFEIPDVKEQLAIMSRNLKELGIDTNQYAVKKIKDSIDRYAYCFKLYGLTSKLLND